VIVVIFENFISLGSAATQLRCSGIFSNNFITNFPQNVTVKKMKMVNIFGDAMDESLRLTFLATLYV